MNGKNLSTVKLKLSIAKTADETDYKLIAEKIPRVDRKRHRRPPKLANDKDDIPYFVDDILQGLSKLGGTSKVSKGTLPMMAMWYDRELLFRALSILKVDYQGNIKISPIRAYVYQVHVLAHQKGLEWIRDCGQACKHRPENRLN